VSFVFAAKLFGVCAIILRSAEISKLHGLQVSCMDCFVCEFCDLLNKGPLKGYIRAFLIFFIWKLVRNRYLCAASARWNRVPAALYQQKSESQGRQFWRTEAI